MMKTKKKNSVPSKKSSKKPTSVKPLMQIDKTIVTTKEKTFTTLEQPYQFSQNATEAMHKNRHIRKESCISRLTQCNLSPFSSPSKSPIISHDKKTLSPHSKIEKQRKNSKNKTTRDFEKGTDKRKNQSLKHQIKIKSKKTNQQCNSEYQNFVFNRLNERKITQVSEKSQDSIRKANKWNMQIIIPKTSPLHLHKPKINRIKELKNKIYLKLTKQDPTLERKYLNFLCKIVLIQRFWRQRKMKSLISEYISPRQNHQFIFTSDSHRETSMKLDHTGTTQELTSQLIKKYHIGDLSQRKSVYEKQLNSTQINTIQRKINLKDLQISSELSPMKQEKMMELVSCLRDISFWKPKEKKQISSKTNVFNLRESLSEKCMIQQFYSKVFKDSPAKKNNFELFNKKKDKNQLERSIQLINTIKTPQKQPLQVIQIQQRFETEANCSTQSREKTVEKVEVSVQTEKIQIVEDRQIKSLKQLTNLSQSIVMALLNEFSEQFHGFTSKTVLKRKKRTRLPGLSPTKQTIEEYLNGFIDYMMRKHQNDVVRRFHLINPLSFLKIHHEYEDDQQEYMNEEDEQMNMPIIPNTLFYQYQLIYQAEKFIVPEENKKYSNFLEGLIKLQNLALTNSLSDMLQKSRIDRVNLPWDKRYESSKSKKSSKKAIFQAQLKRIAENVCKYSFLHLGDIHRDITQKNEQEKLLKSISEQYKHEGADWTPQYQSLEIRIDITKHIQQLILEETIKDIMIFF